MGGIFPASCTVIFFIKIDVIAQLNPIQKNAPDLCFGH